MRQAYNRRKEKHERKEMLKFIPLQSLLATKKLKETKKWMAKSTSSTGLKGGAPKAKVHPSKVQMHHDKNGQLRLSNRGTDCFVNSVVQLMRSTGYATFIKMHYHLLRMMLLLMATRYHGPWLRSSVVPVLRK